MNKLTVSLIAAGLMTSGVAFAQSAKFTSIWNESATLVRSEACAEVNLEDTYCDDLGLSNTGAQVAYQMATIRVPQAKELLVGVSAQVELFTENLVKGKKGTNSRSLAMAEGGVYLYACSDGACYEGRPGRVVLSKRTQELEAILGGVIESCTVDVVVDPDTGIGSGSFDLDQCVVEQESIRLALTTMAAHHFNFVFPNLPQGDYEVVAKFDTNAQAEAEVTCDLATYEFCDPADGSAGGAAYAVIGKTMMTVQEVRAVKDEGGDPVIID